MYTCDGLCRFTLSAHVRMVLKSPSDEIGIQYVMHIHQIIYICVMLASSIALHDNSRCFNVRISVHVEMH